MNKMILGLVATLSLTGCMLACRVPVPVEEHYAGDGACTNRVWRSMISQCRRRSGTNCVLWCYYQTLKMRTHVWSSVYCSADDSHGRKRWAWATIGLTWLCAPMDVVVDTIVLPYDYEAMKEDNR